MGNQVSCSMISPKMRVQKAARVIFPGGEIRQFRERVKAAELMLDCPNFFLVSPSSLDIGRRFNPLYADEELELGNVYILFPMRRVNSVVTAADMAALFLAANSPSRRIPSGKKVGQSPEAVVRMKTTKTGESSTGEEGRGTTLKLMDVDVEMKHRWLGVCRSRKPLLDTIMEVEEPRCWCVLIKDRCWYRWLGGCSSDDRRSFTASSPLFCPFFRSFRRDRNLYALSSCSFVELHSMLMLQSQ